MRTGAPPRGLPDHLPEGEHLLWQGAPEWRTLARQALHVRGIAVYFAILLSWYVASSVYDGTALQDAALSTARLALLAAVPVALLIGYAWLVSRATVYSVTSRRIVLRIGLTLPITINLPFSQIEAVSMKQHGGGIGDICLLPNASDQLAYLVLWPHARPWRVARAEPMLRSIADADHVGKLLADALADSPSVNSPPREVAAIPEFGGSRRRSPVAA